MSTPNKRTGPPDDFSTPGKKPVQVAEDRTQERSEDRLLRRKFFLESAIRITFGTLCGCFLFSHPVIIVLFILFLAYMYVVQL